MGGGGILAAEFQLKGRLRARLEWRDAALHPAAFLCSLWWTQGLRLGVPTLRSLACPCCSPACRPSSLPAPPQIAVAVGGGRTADACEALHRRHASYLAIPKEFQSVQAFTAMVENAQKEAAAEQPSSGGGEEGAGSGGGAGSRLKLEEEGEGEGDDAQASGRHGAEEGSEDGYGEDGEPSLAAGRSRRTPKRAGLRTPLSAAKRGRGDENIYEYQGEGADAVTESARKRRAPRGALEFPASQRRRHDTGADLLHPGWRLCGGVCCML